MSDRAALRVAASISGLLKDSRPDDQLMQGIAALIGEAMDEERGRAYQLGYLAGRAYDLPESTASASE